jgi:uncharacterized protein YndB with AHSA1/START domain
MDEAQNLFSISRVFEAPRALVWKAWSEAERLAQWWGPKGMAVTVHTLEFRPGGVFHYALHGPDGRPAMWGRFVYREIAAPERIVFVSSFSDEKGGIARAPFPKIGETWPLQVLNRLLLTEENGRTTVSLTGGPIDATEAERRTYEGMFDSMRHGFGGTFDQLAEHLARERARAA